jgi:hypothetical protein
MANRSKDLAASGASLLALAPGFVLPFTFSLTLGAERSDQILLAASIGITLASILSSAIEANTVAVYGRLLGRGLWPTARRRRSYMGRVMATAAAVTVIVAPILSLLYGHRAGDPQSIYLLSTIISVTPFISVISAVYGGRLIADGRPTLVVASQALRAIFPLVTAGVAPGIPLIWIALSYVVGELARAVLLAVLARSQGNAAIPDQRPLPTRGILWQSLSTATAQTGPVTARFLLAGAGPGFITAYEIADKLYFAGLQFINQGVLIRRFGRWARITSMTRGAVAALIGSDAKYLAFATCGVAALGAACTLLSAGLVPADPTLSIGLAWASILYISLPFSVLNTAVSRLIVIARMQRKLMYFALANAALTTLLSVVLYALIGPVGVPLSVVAARIALGWFYALGGRSAVRSAASADNGDD